MLYSCVSNVQCSHMHALPADSLQDCKRCEQHFVAYALKMEATLVETSQVSKPCNVMQVVGLDMVDDESKPERRPAKHMQTPAEWNLKHNPAYSYYAYYVYANLFTLNKLREARGLNTIAFRPHAGRGSFLTFFWKAAVTI